MATRPQHSKRDRGREHVGLPPKQAQRRKCPDCGEWFWNRGAHYEACRGSLSEEDRDGRQFVTGVEGNSHRLASSEREFTGWYGVSGLCSCGWRRDGGRCVHGNPYVPVFLVKRATEGE